MHLRLTHLAAWSLLPLLFTAADIHSAPVGSPAVALSAALKGTQASGVVIDLQTGATLASVGPPRSGAPGSVTKPLWLAYALEHGIVTPQTQVYCRRNLKIDYRSLPCTHPADRAVFVAETALAESCNSWFAELGRRYTGAQLDAAINAAELPHKSMAVATTEQRELAVLGLSGVTVSPSQLASAYRNLLLHLPQVSPVRSGMRGSVDYGMANPAAVSGLEILGKTGTASDPGEAWTHGWFAGSFDRYIVVIYVPHGDGGIAAALAHTFFAALAPGKRP